MIYLRRKPPKIHSPGHSPVYSRCLEGNVMKVYCSFALVLRVAFWIVVVGIFLGVLLTHRGDATQAGSPPATSVGYQQAERGCFGNADS
jgi:hypothetical protein